MLEAFEIGFYVLLVLPGFIFVQTRDYHLLREAKGQFEKTLEIILWSAVIWVIAAILPLEIVFLHCRDATLTQIRAAVSAVGPTSAPVWTSALTPHAAWFFLLVCAYAFIAANLWGYLRKKRRVDARIRYLTGRDWFPSVAHRFYSENIDKLVVVQAGETRYCGILFGAPDNKEDKYILLKKVAVLPRPGTEGAKPEPLTLVESILVDISDVKEVQALTPQLLRPTADGRKRGIRGWVRSIMGRIWSV